MEKKKQIDKMLEAQCKFYGNCDNCPVYPNKDEPLESCRQGCERLYENGWRKASDVAREIIDILNSAGIDRYRYPIIAEIEKKYTGEKNNE